MEGFAEPWRVVGRFRDAEHNDISLAVQGEVEPFGDSKITGKFDGRALEGVMISKDDQPFAAVNVTVKQPRHDSFPMRGASAVIAMGLVAASVMAGDVYSGLKLLAYYLVWCLAAGMVGFATKAVLEKLSRDFQPSLSSRRRDVVLLLSLAAVGAGGLLMYETAVVLAKHW